MITFELESSATYHPTTIVYGFSSIISYILNKAPKSIKLIMFKNNRKLKMDVSYHTLTIQFQRTDHYMYLIFKIYTTKQIQHPIKKVHSE